MTGHIHNPLDHLTECLPFNYDPKGSNPAIQAFLQSAIPDPEGRRAYMTHVGLSLIGDRSLHKALVLLGPPRSGKTTLLKLAQLTLGVAPGQFPSAILFSSQGRGANSRATWRDHSPRLVCLDEFPEEAVRDEGEDLFKSMTAHGGVAMWHTYQREHADNVWTPKLLFATNNRMRYRDPSGALTRRLLVVSCPNGLPDHKLDGNLLNKLSTELGAFAAQCIQLALEAQKNHAYPESAAMRALLADIERSGDAVKLWASEQCILDPNTFTSTQILYGHFKLWCEENGLHAVSRPKLRDLLCGSNPGVAPSKRRAVDPVSGVSKPVWGLVGIRLRMESDDEG
jgi:putative DNA primase/helicase